MKHISKMIGIVILALLLVSPIMPARGDGTANKEVELILGKAKTAPTTMSCPFVTTFEFKMRTDKSTWAVINIAKNGKSIWIMDFYAGQNNENDREYVYVDKAWENTASLTRERREEIIRALLTDGELLGMQACLLFWVQDL